MAKRLIDADALMEHTKNLPTWWPDDGSYYMESMKYPQGMFDPEDIISSIENAPTVDAVEVVRCRGCAWYDEDGRCVNSHCTKSYYGCHVPQQHYCSYGERRNDGKL